MSRARHEVKKAKGGRIGMVASGNPDVIEEAKERKKGGKVKHVEMEGMKGKHRMDRPKKRAFGGRVGADKMPFSSAKLGSKTKDMSDEPNPNG